MKFFKASKATYARAFVPVVLAALAVMIAGWSLALAAPQSIVILHTNDTHAHVDPFKPGGSNDEVGGSAKLAGLIGVIRADSGEIPVLLFDAGDAIQGSNVGNAFAGASIIAIMNQIGYNLMAIGNHEFDYGQDALKERMKEARFPLVGANIIDEKSGEPFANSYAVFNVGGVKLGVLGLSPQETPIVTHPKNVIGLKFDDPIQKAAEIAQILKDVEKVDIIVALTHIGFENDKKLAEAVPAINLIIGGHSHTKLDKPVKVGDTTIVQTGEYGANLGYTRLMVEDGKLLSVDARLIPVTKDVAEDSAVREMLDGYKAELKGKMDVVVGEATVALDGERANVRTKETNLGDLITDIMRSAVAADVAVTNGGGIRASIKPGPITLGAIYSAIPFDNTLVKLEVKGSDLLAALERGVSAYPKEAGSFLHVSGLSFEFDPAKPAGQRVVGATVGGRPLDRDAVYTVATNDFMAAGGDGYDMFKSAKKLADTGIFLRDAAAQYITGIGKVAASVEGRIKVAGQ